MPSNRKPTAAHIEKPAALALALEQSQDVKERVEAVADDLASANDIVKQKIAEGATTLPAATALANTERVEAKVQECADDLHQVNATLAQGIVDQKRTEIAFSKSRKSLAKTEVALATAQEEEKNARMRALHDATTGLANRSLFDARLEHSIALAERHGWTLAVMFFDLDSFKIINDTHGHAAGDWVLKEIAKRLLEHCRDEDTVCRNGGDEFLYLLMNPQGSENIERIAGVVSKTIAQPIEVGDLQLVVNASIGIAVYPDNGPSGEELIRNADTAMYRAKKQKSGCVFFNALRMQRPAA